MSEMKPYTFDLAEHIRRQRTFSERTFGPGTRTNGVLDHMRKEMREVQAAPTDLTEWVDLILLAVDGAWRSGHSPEAICIAIQAKQTRNELRKWPDWRTAEPGKAIEHQRDGEASSGGHRDPERADVTALILRAALIAFAHLHGNPEDCEECGALTESGDDSPCQIHAYGRHSRLLTELTFGPSARENEDVPWDGKVWALDHLEEATALVPQAESSAAIGEGAVAPEEVK